MKRRGLFVALLLVGAIFLSSFILDKAYAQTANITSDTYNIPLAVFSNALSNLQKEKLKQDEAYKTNQNNPDYVQYLQINTLLSTLVTRSQSIYTQNVSTNSTPDQYKTGLQVTVKFILDYKTEQARLARINNEVNLATNLGASGFIGAIVNQLNNEAQKDVLTAQYGVDATQKKLADNQATANAVLATGGARGVNQAEEDPSVCEMSLLRLKFNILGCIDTFVGYLIKNTLIQFAGFFLWMSANLLDYIINIGILQYSKWAPSGLYQLWKMVSQVVDMFVVFSAVFLGFMYIINQQETFVKRFLPWFVLFGLFANFSYPITRGAIDISNIISLNIYASAIGTTDTFTGKNTNTAGAILMREIGLQSLWFGASSAPNTAKYPDILGNLSGIPASLLILLYIIYATYVFFIAASILFMRTIALSFIIVGSPLLFVDAVIPKLGEQAQKIRKIFFEQLSVSIIFMVMLYLSIQMLHVFKSIPTSGASGKSIGDLLNILMMIVVLHIMLKVTKEVAGSIGQIATNYLGKVGGFATGAAIGLATGGAGLLARETIGATAARWSTSTTMKNAQGSWVGRRALDLTSSLANSSFDARNTKAMSMAGVMGGLSKGLGTGRTVGYTKAQEAKIADINKRAGMIQDEGKRNAYLDYQSGNTIQLGKNKVLGRVGFEGNEAKTTGQLAVEKFRKEEGEKKEKAMLDYTNATDVEKAKMKENEENKRFANNFAEIDEFHKEGTSDERKNEFYNQQSDQMKEALRAKEIGQATKQNNDQIKYAKEYLEATPEALEVLAKRATESQKQLYAQLAEYKAIPVEDHKRAIDSLMSLNNETLARAIIKADNRDELSTKGNEARRAKLSQGYTEAKVVAPTVQTASTTVNQTVNQEITLETKAEANKRTGKLELESAGEELSRLANSGQDIMAKYAEFMKENNAKQSYGVTDAIDFSEKKLADMADTGSLTPTKETA
jgi:hypothetical protein